MAIELTQNAVNHVQKFIQKDPESEYLRLAVKPTGCSGFMYEVTTTGEKIANDCVFNSGGITIIVDEQSLKYHRRRFKQRIQIQQSKRRCNLWMR